MGAIEVFDQDALGLERLKQGVGAAGGHPRQNKVGLAGIGVYARQGGQGVEEALALLADELGLFVEAGLVAEDEGGADLGEDIDVVG